MAATGSGAALVSRARERTKKLRTEVRRADQVLGELESLLGDQLGKLVIAPGETPETADVTGYLSLLQEQYPDTEIEIIVIAREETGREDVPA